MRLTNTATVPPASNARARGSVAWRQIRDTFKGAASSLRSAWRSPWKVAVLLVWGTAILLDASTTAILLQKPEEFAEANPIAALGMGAVGLLGYLFVGSLFAIAWAVMATAKPIGFYGWVAVCTAVALGGFKLFIAINNATLMFPT